MTTPDGRKERHLLITGRPGTGKTTLLMALARRFARVGPAGFYTEEVREGGQRRGFQLKDFQGIGRRFADVSFKSPHRVGRYGVDLEGFDEFLTSLDLLSHPSPLVFLDEIGKMECLSPRFVRLVEELFASQKTVIATVALQGGGLIGKVKASPAARVVEVTFANRQTLLDQLAEWVEWRATGRGTGGG